MRAKTPDNRIVFIGSPWPKGHAIKEFAWSARLDPKSGISFDLHLASAPYDAEDLKKADEDNKTDRGNWRSKTVWKNYHSCTISSVEWDHSGFLVATRHSPLNFETLTGRQFTVDPLPFDLENEPSFGIYLQGHDTAAGHRIRFTKTASDSAWTIDWQGSIALTYLGGQEFRYKFKARKTGVTFGGITLPAGTKEDQAAKMLAPFVRDIKSYSLKKARDGKLRFRYTGTKKSRR